VICPKCGEDNSDNFRFCGMCGTVLETRRTPGTLTLDPQSGFPPGFPPKTTTAPDPVRPAAIENAARLAGKQVPPISGPSMLGLNQPGVGQSPPRQHSQSQSSQNQSSMDSLRERAFSGLDSFFEPEQPKTSGRRTLLLVGLLVALGGAGWWTYTNYLGATESRKPDATSVANSSADDAPAKATSTKPSANDAVAAPDARPSQAASSSARIPDSTPENASAAPDGGAKPLAATKSALPAPATSTPAKIVSATKSTAKSEPGVTSVRAARLPVAATADTGDADFRKGEAFLYGRGAAENCDEAMKYLRAASAKSNAKARSTLGTMYDTGHCAPRDLPTSYLWFALALQVDPNNQILEKDLSAVWNQMTPPERQMATRMKQ
jgi:hypothetical protein